MRIYNYVGGSGDTRGWAVSNGNNSAQTAENSAANLRVERTSAAGIDQLDNVREQVSGDSITALRRQIESLPPEKAKPLIDKLEKMREQTNDPLATLKNQLDILSLGRSESLIYTPTYNRMGLRALPR
jgi:hypothetical protein